MPAAGNPLNPDLDNFSGIRFRMEGNELSKIFSEELRETRGLASAAQQYGDASMMEAKACWAQVEQLRELILIKSQKNLHK